MNRRDFVTAAAGTGVSMPAAAAPASRSVFALRYFRLRNSHADQTRRTSEFLERGVLPAAKRLGIGPLGCFTGVIAADSPFVLLLASFPSLAAMETSLEKMAADSEYRKALEAYHAGVEPPYTRMETSLLRAFPSMPAVEAQASGPKRPARIFELRTYESPTSSTLQRKIRMFGDGEIDIFRRCGLAPVFFGETIVGQNMPNLTYMVAFDDMAGREKAWNTFRVDPEWLKLRKQPDLADAEIVSNISNAILRPLPFSPIR